MPKSPNNKKPKKNATEERLRATPFSDPGKLDAEEQAIRLAAWTQYTESRVKDELRTKPEFSHINEELEAGLECDLSDGKTVDRIYKIFAKKRGLKLELNKKFTETLGKHQVPFYQSTVQAGIEGFGALSMQVKGLLSRPNLSAKDMEQLAKVTKKIGEN